MLKTQKIPNRTKKMKNKKNKLETKTVLLTISKNGKEIRYQNWRYCIMEL